MPAKGAEVCVLDPASTPRAAEFERCAHADVAGNYAVRSLPAGTYIVVFSPFRPPVDSAPFAQQYYANATTKATATAISLVPPATKSGVDATLVSRLQTTLRPLSGFRTVTSHGAVRLGFRFFSKGVAESFICKRDSAPWRSCRSPEQFWAPLGRHAFRVRAVSANNDKGPVALNRFRVTRSPSSKHGAR
jgi:hypothetical protein